jgi:hypothetical protein
MTLMTAEEVRADLDAAFEARRQRLMAELPASHSVDFLAQVRRDIDDLLYNAIDWVALHQSDPRSEKAAAALSRF